MLGGIDGCNMYVHMSCDVQRGSWPYWPKVLSFWLHFLQEIYVFLFGSVCNTEAAPCQVDWSVFTLWVKVFHLLSIFCEEHCIFYDFAWSAKLRWHFAKCIWPCAGGTAYAPCVGKVLHSLGAFFQEMCGIWQIFGELAETPTAFSQEQA